MKKLIVFAVVIFSSIGLFAQNDAEAKKILDGVSAKFKAFKTVQGTFNVKIENKQGKKVGSKTGSIFMKGGKYKITEKSTEIISDGVTQWRYEPAANEVTISKVDGSNATITPQKMFSNFYDKDFLYKLNGEKTLNGKKVQEIEMTPTDKRKNFFKVYVYIDKITQTIASTKVLENTGNVVTYSITNMKTDLPIDDKVFIFDKTKHPGVEEIQFWCRLFILIKLQILIDLNGA
jgi:outer membrane lipoprotein carrier protein